MITHELRIGTNDYQRIAAGIKTFEVRYNDEGYQVGDKIRFENVGDEPFIADNLYKIIYVHSGYGMDSRFVVLGIKKAELYDS